MGPGGEWRFTDQGAELRPLLEALSREQDPTGTRIRLSLDQAGLLETHGAGGPCHNLVSGGRRRLKPGGKPEPVRAGAVIQGTLGINRLLGAARWQKLQGESTAEQDRRLGRDLDAFADAADYLWEHGYLRLAQPDGVYTLPCGWLPAGPSPLETALLQAIAAGQSVCVQLKPRRIDPDLRYAERAVITGLEAGVARSSLGEYPLEAVHGLDREGSC